MIRAEWGPISVKTAGQPVLCLAMRGHEGGVVWPGNKGGRQGLKNLAWLAQAGGRDFSLQLFVGAWPSDGGIYAGAQAAKAAVGPGFKGLEQVGRPPRWPWRESSMCMVRAALAGSRGVGLQPSCHQARLQPAPDPGISV